MNASDLGTYLAMGGYGLYVWGSMGMCACAAMKGTTSQKVSWPRLWPKWPRW